MNTLRAVLLIGAGCLWLINASPAQLREDFSDEDLLHNPAWQGDIDHWRINRDGELQLSRGEGGESELWTPYHLPEGAVLSTYFRLHFNPSSANRIRFYLWSDEPDKDAESALWCEHGESGNEDKVRFYYRYNGRDSLLGSIDTVLIEDPVECRFAIIPDPNGSQLAFALSKNGAFHSLQKIRPIQTEPSSGYFGVFAKYTSSRGSHFFIDDIVVVERNKFNIQPDVVDLLIKEQDLLCIEFNTAMSIDTADPGISITSDINGFIDYETKWSPDRANEICLELENIIQNGELIDISIDSMVDFLGNVMVGWDTNIIYTPTLEPIRGDIRINEIYSDPEPSNGLPYAEYIEILNVSDKKLKIDNLSVGDASSMSIAIDRGVLFPGEYAILSDLNTSSVFPDTVKFFGVSGFPALNNGGDIVKLMVNGDQIIDSLEYNRDFYGDLERSGGGWSMECINPFVNCHGYENWSASEHISGGTPGKINSVFDTIPPKGYLRINDIQVLDDRTLRLGIDQSILWDKMIGKTNWRIHPILQVEELSWLSIQNKVELWTNPFLSGQRYRIFPHPDMETCRGVKADTSQYLEFGLPQKIEVGDLVINEVLYDPYTGGSEFIELYNQSERVFHSDSIQITLINANGDSTIYRHDEGFFIFPKEYMILSKDLEGVDEFYEIPMNAKVLVGKLPPLTNDGGEILLINNSGVVVDRMVYDDDFHATGLDETQGISLERLSPFMPGESQENWYSAATLVGGATPCMPNSQRKILTSADSSIFALYSQTFSPDHDGFEDQMILSYTLDEPGVTAVIKIYDVAGRFVKYLINNESLGMEGVITWDGTDKNGNICRVGMYILEIELLLNREIVSRDHRTIVLARPLNGQ